MKNIKKQSYALFYCIVLLKCYYTSVLNDNKWRKR